MFCIFFFNSTATTDIYTYVHTLSLHDALPIYTVAGRDPLAVATSFGELEKLMAARAMLWVEADDRGLTPAKADNPYWTTRPEGPPATFSDRFELGEHWTPFLPSELLPEDGRCSATMYSTGKGPQAKTGSRRWWREPIGSSRRYAASAGATSRSISILPIDMAGMCCRAGPGRARGTHRTAIIMRRPII